MTWVIWRQYRATAAVAGAILAAFAVLFLITGLQDAARWHAALASCAKNGTCANLSQLVSLTTGPVYTLTILTLAVPLLQGVVPIGYAVFAVALGIAAGTLIGRSLPAFAATAGVFLAVRLVITYWVRVHFIPAVTTIHSVTQSFTPTGAYWQLAQGVVRPGGQLTTSLIANPGTIQQFPGATWPASCPQAQQMSSTLACLAHLGYRSFVTYQPGYRFWPFQFIETGIFAALATVLIAVTFFVVRRRDA
jgi:hypothetical protein